ncbi:multidrug resistance-associated ABC transporter [Thelephora ganbajun]|uniref:Multidrug resistance-associated ABC transporter n=1 Tax=Thelephora ganbajun TaxID=370292 RepID=A0ACB6ZLT0_THEGA|nr:multidrug resistance-associated ABC transporter [Thelephora ganbajun]
MRIPGLSFGDLPPSLYQSSQVVVQGYSSIFVFEEHFIWEDSLILPPLFATISLLVIIVHYISTRKFIKKAWAHFTKSPIEEEPSEPNVATDPNGFFAELSHHAKSLGGVDIFIYRVLRLLSVFTLVSLSAVTFVLDEAPSLRTIHKGKNQDKKHKHHRGGNTLTYWEWLDLALSVTYVYAAFLSIIAISARPRIANLANTHLVWVLFGTWLLFAYRDLYPLATFTLSPIDIEEGWLLWSKVGVLTFVATILPIVVPSQYIPFDPKNPASEPNPEQTASWLSFSLFTFLDPLIIKASRVPHLPLEECPPLADYDWAPHLIQKSFPHLDPLSGIVKKHAFWGFMKVFRKEYITLAFLMAFRTFVGFMNPVAVNRLLTYLGTGGKDALFHPWVWIALLFIGPFLSSVIFQWYIFITTRLLTQAQGMITQLVFEHALRIRMKSESSESSPCTSQPSTSAPTPDTASVAESSSGHSPDGTENTEGTFTTPASGATPPEADKASIKGEEKKPTGEKGGNLVGKINNLVSTDLNNIIDGRDFLMIAVACPIQIILCIVFLYTILGWSAIVGMVTMVALFPVPGYFAAKLQTIQNEKMKMTDSRVQVVTEIMNVIRMVKLFGWEKKMDEKIAQKREEELYYQKKRLFLEILNGMVNFLIPIITMIVSFACYTVVMKKQLTAAKVFSAMSVFDMLRDQMWMVFGSIPMMIQAKVSLDRLNDFLRKTELLDEFDPNSKDTTIADNVKANTDLVGIRNASFTWTNKSNETITPGSSRRNFTLRINDEVIFRKGKINLIVGPTGCGKTSLLMALLGELHYVAAGPDSWYNLPRAGGVAYAAQESWVQNETIRNNILFGSPYDEQRYKKVIYQCGLSRDLTLFDAGDKTEVGEKGLTLSGGQKARVTLARAIYSQAQILILDDVLAALDVHTARWVVDKCLQGDLVHGRTVLLVTHNVAMTSPIADFVVSLGSEGRILSQGTMSKALATSKALTKELKVEESELRKAEEAVDGEVPIVPEGKSGKLMVAEEVAEGHVSWSALKLFFIGMGGSYSLFFWFTVIVSLGLTEVSLAVQTWYLGVWSAQYDNHDASEVSSIRYLLVYCILLTGASILYAMATSIFTFGSLRASRAIHRKLISSVLSTTLRWLDSTPTARVIARCTQDMQAVDGPISRNLSALLEISLSMLIKFGAVIVFSPIFTLPGIAAFLVGGWAGQMYIKAQLSVKREMSNARSPVLSHFGAAIAGIVSIRAYSAQDMFKKGSLDYIDKFSQPARTFYNLNRWISIRIDIIGALFSSGLAAYLVYGTGAIHRPGYAAAIGFSLNMAVGFSSMILWWVRILNEFEVSGNSLERIQDYVDIEQEPKATPDGVPPAYWPVSGEVLVENLSAKYSPGGPEVLHNLNFRIASGERVGVVGRTGSGKSSLTLALLRCIFTEGIVYFDGMDTNKINLEALRTNITIIPQVPELLSDTLRGNLDPFDQYDDATLNDALRAAGLFSVQSEDDEGRITLETAISSGGGNLSIGQRQILALARAIVRRSKLLILDEATSAIDYETDTVIQSSLRHGLGPDVTLLTIAHRLQTIMDADKIMVLDAGKIVEFGKPSELLKIEAGKLKSLVDESGDKDALYGMAK